jgi:hypothetical protein
LVGNRKLSSFRRKINLNTALPSLGARFCHFNVWTEKKRLEKLRYIHRNLVARGLVESQEQWQYSSFRWSPQRHDKHRVAYQTGSNQNVQFC